MATLHRPRRRTAVWTSLIVVLLLSACGAPATSPAAPGSSTAPSAQPSSQPSPSAAPSTAPSAAPASPAAEQPTQEPPASTEPSLPATPQSGSQPDSGAPAANQPDSHTPNAGAFYLFPENLPTGFEVRPAGALADTNVFSVDIARVGQANPVATITGGKSSKAAEPPTNAGQQAEVMIRTSKGMAYQNGAGYSVYWQEQGVPYAIIGELSLDEATVIADALQSTDLVGWQTKLAEVAR
jgi:hypothetical protein